MVIDARIHLDITRSRFNRVTALDVVLGGDMPEAKQRGGQARDRVIEMRYAEGRPVCGGSEVVSDAGEADFWGPVGVLFAYLLALYPSYILGWKWERNI